MPDKAHATIPEKLLQHLQVQVRRMGLRRVSAILDPVQMFLVLDQAPGRGRTLP